MGRIRLLAITLATFATLLLTSAAGAQTVRAYVNVDSISVGERMNFTVAVDRVEPRSGAVTFPTPPPDTLGSFLRFGDLLIVDVIGNGTIEQLGGVQTDSIVYEATTFALDTARTTAVPVLLTSGTDTLVLATNAFLIPVRSVVPSDAEDILDLMPIAEFRQPIWPWLLFVLVLLVAMAAFIYWYRRPPHQTVLERASAQPSLPPHEEAYARLDELESQPLETEVAREQFCVDLSDILRTYVWRRTAVHALEMTTNELVDRVASMETSDEMSEGLSSKIDSVLEVCDLAKFAEIFPTATACLDEATRTREVIAQVEEHYAPIPLEIAGADDEPVAHEIDDSEGADESAERAGTADAAMSRDAMASTTEEEVQDRE